MFVVRIALVAAKAALPNLWIAIVVLQSHVSV